MVCSTIILRYFVLFAALVLGMSCSTHLTYRTAESDRGQVPKKETNANIERADSSETPVSEESNISENRKTHNKEPDAERNKECHSSDTGDRFVLENQTFPIDFKPFENACFVTSHDPEFDDPPLGSVFSIYKDGKNVYEFDSRFNPDAASCWVEGVAFEDLTDDGLIDIIVVGKCGLKPGETQGNEVFINNGKGFYTVVESNDRLDDVNKIKDIADFVRKNNQLFAK